MLHHMYTIVIENSDGVSDEEVIELLTEGKEVIADMFTDVFQNPVTVKVTAITDAQLAMLKEEG